MTVSFKEYQDDLKEFCQHHNKKAECTVYTSPMVNNVYTKYFMYSDGATFTEVNDFVTEDVKVEAHGMVMTVPVKFFRTEYYSTDNSKSKFVYQKA